MKKNLLFITFLAGCAFATAQTIVSTGSMATARVGHESEVLASGNVIAMGGDNYTLSNFQTYKSCELYNSTTGTWSAGPNMKDLRSYFSAVTLNNGKILVMGGVVGDYYSGSGSVYVRKSCELYDPSTNTWSYTDSMQNARYGHFAVKLSNGKVLVAGGNLSATACELYDPATGTWSATGSITNARENQSIVLLANGNVLLSGGYTNKAQVYNTASGTWNAEVTMNATHNYHHSILLNNNKVLIASGGSVQCELYDPATNTFSVTGSVPREKNRCPEVVLANGNVLSYGLGDIFSFTNTKCIDIYEVASGIWTNTTYSTSTNPGAQGYTMETLGNGKILIVGGTATTGNGAHKLCYLISGTSAGIHELDALPSFNIFPNPAKNHIVVKEPLSGKNAECFIYGIDGSLKLSRNISEEDKQINIEELPAGNYVIILKDGDKSRSARFIKE